MDLGQFVNDTDSMLNGVWVDFMDGRILIAKFGNPNYQAFIQGNRVPEAAVDFEGGKASDELVDLMCRGMAETVLLGWEGFTIRGEPVEYSTETAYRVLKQFDGFRNQVIAQSSQQAHFANEEFEEALNKIGPF